MAVEWYYASRRDRFGPFSQDALQREFTSNTLPPTTAVWAEHLTEWLPANEVDELKSFISTAAVRCESCAFVGPRFISHPGYKLWMLPIGLALAATGIGLIPLVFILSVIGNRTSRACPKCGSQKNLQNYYGAPSGDAEEVLQNAKIADDRRLKQSKTMVFAVALTLLAAAIAFGVYILK